MQKREREQDHVGEEIQPDEVLVTLAVLALLVREEQEGAIYFADLNTRWRQRPKRRSRC